MHNGSVPVQLRRAEINGSNCQKNRIIIFFHHLGTSICLYICRMHLSYYFERTVAQKLKETEEKPPWNVYDYLFVHGGEPKRNGVPMEVSGTPKAKGRFTYEKTKYFGWFLVVVLVLSLTVTSCQCNVMCH